MNNPSNNPAWHELKHPLALLAEYVEAERALSTPAEAQAALEAFFTACDHVWANPDDPHGLEAVRRAREEL